VLLQQQHPGQPQQRGVIGEAPHHIRAAAGSLGGSDATHWVIARGDLAGHRRCRGGAAQHFSSSNPNCAKLGTIAVTIVAGPLNDAGVNPKVKCTLPQPST
jgi:hypothetical protein